MKKECLFCDFCGKSQYEVVKIILGPRSVAICDVCARLAADIADGKAERMDMQAGKEGAK